MNEHEDAFIEVISKKIKNPEAEICTQAAEYCEDLPEDADDEDNYEYDFSDSIEKDEL